MEITLNKKTALGLAFGAIILCIGLIFVANQILSGKDNPTDNLDVDSTSVAASANNSKLWGANGELWDGGKSSRLTDYSYAGYDAGRSDIPLLPEASDVTDFGATPNDSTDDTAAFEAAIEATEEGAIIVPKGRYILSKQLRMRNDNTVLRGEGGQTCSSTGGDNRPTLYFTKSLDQLGLRADGTASAGNGGLISLTKHDFVNARKLSTTPLARVTANAARGDQKLTLSDTTNLKAGDLIYLHFTNITPDFLIAVNGGLDNGEFQPKVYSSDTYLPVEIQSISGRTVTIHRPLILPIKPIWGVDVYGFAGSENMGVENLIVEFPNYNYPGHFGGSNSLPQGREYNGIYVNGVNNCWIRDVTVKGATNGISLWSFTRNCSVINTEILSNESDGTQINPGGHYGIQFYKAFDNLVSDLKIEDYVHDASTKQFASGNVYRNITSSVFEMDYHGRAAHNNLYSNISSVLGTEILRASGSSSGENPARPPQAAGWNTLWNFQHTGDYNNYNYYTAEDWKWSWLTIVGPSLAGQPQNLDNSARIYAERINNLSTKDLFEAQLQKRLNKTAQSSIDFCELEPSSPIGFHSNTATKCTIQGWACDADNYSQALEISIFEGGGPATGNSVATIKADAFSQQQINSLCGNTENHRFSYDISGDYADGQDHDFYVYAININPDGTRTRSGNALLNNSPVTMNCTPVTCTNFSYSSWSECSKGGKQTRTVFSSSPENCEGGNPVLERACTYIPPTCTGFTYSAWSSCNNGTQTRTITSSSPNNCTGGTPALSRTCTDEPGIDPTDPNACKPIDSNGDNKLTIIDFANFVNIFNSSCNYVDLSGCGSADTNKNGKVDVVDFGSFVSRFGKASCVL